MDPTIFGQKETKGEGRMRRVAEGRRKVLPPPPPPPPAAAAAAECKAAGRKEKTG